MLAVKNSITKNLKVASGSVFVLVIFYFLFTQGTDGVPFYVMIALSVVLFNALMAVFALLDRRKKIVIDETGVLLPGKLKDCIPWQEIFIIQVSQSFGRYQLTIMNTVMQRQSYYFFPLDVEIKDLSEFLNKRIEEKTPCLINSGAEQKETEFDYSEPVSPKNSGDRLEANRPEKNLPADAADEEDEEDDGRLYPVRFSDFPVISDALASGVIFSAVCFILVVFAQIDDPGPNTISMGTGMVYVIASFFLGVVFWPIANALFDFRREFFHGIKPAEPKLSKKKKVKKPVEMQMKKRR